jgi:hypothetical protein
MASHSVCCCVPNTAVTSESKPKVKHSAIMASHPVCSCVPNIVTKMEMNPPVVEQYAHFIAGVMSG